MAKAQRSRQLAMFPRPERLTPEMARPDQFHRLPGVMWHGNYDPSSVSKPTLNFNLNTGTYTPVGVHAGTKRAAMDALDWHGEYNAERDMSVIPPEHHWGGPEEYYRQETKSRGPHGYLHPVLPSRILPGRESAAKIKGLWGDPGDDWTPAISMTNYRQIGKVQDKWSLDDTADPWRKPQWHPDEVKHGLRYQNDTEHPGSTSVLIPTSAPMQQSDYVREAMLNGRKVHPLTQRLYDEGVLDQASARKYLPMKGSPIGVNVTPSDVKRQARTSRVKAARSRQFVKVQEELPFEEKS